MQYITDEDSLNFSRMISEALETMRENSIGIKKGVVLILIQLPKEPLC